jgi:hypothetical protein
MRGRGEKGGKKIRNVRSEGACGLEYWSNVLEHPFLGCYKNSHIYLKIYTQFKCKFNV